MGNTIKKNDKLHSVVLNGTIVIKGDSLNIHVEDTKLVFEEETTQENNG